MSVEQLESQVLALPLAERRAFTRWLDEHRDEIEQPSVLVRAQESEVRQRLDEMEADPSLRIPFAEADVEQLFKEIIDERAAKTSPRKRVSPSLWRIRPGLSQRAQLVSQLSPLIPQLPPWHLVSGISPSTQRFAF